MADKPNLPAVQEAPALPDHLKQYQATTSDADSMAASSISIPRVSLKAKFFRYNIGGEEIKKEPKTRFVILGVDPAPGKFIKTYYAGKYSGDSVPPTCSSQDGLRPDPWAEAIQSDLCATCPQNRFGSATSASGKKTKACRDSKRLWIVDPQDVSGQVFALGVPVTSLKSLSALGKQFADLNVPISAAIVEATMDEDESYPILYFSIVEWLDAETAGAAIKRNGARDWEGGMRSENPTPAIPVKSNAGLPPPAVTPAVPAEAKSGNLDEAIKNW